MSRRREIAESILLALGLGLTYAGVHITKAATDRLRPPDPLVTTDLSSYPSAHAAYAIAWVAVAVTLEPAGGVPAPTGERYLVGTPAPL